MGVQQFTRPLSEFNQSQINIIENAVNNSVNGADWSRYDYTRRVTNVFSPQALTSGVETEVVNMYTKGFFSGFLYFPPSYACKMRIYIDGVLIHTKVAGSFKVGGVSQRELLKAISSNVSAYFMDPVPANDYFSGSDVIGGFPENDGGQSIALIPIPVYFKTQLKITIESIGGAQTVNSMGFYVYE